MRIQRLSAIAVAIVISASALSAGNEVEELPSPVVVRLSYRSSWVEPGTWGQNESPRICISIRRNRQYRMFYTSPLGSQWLEGVMPAEEHSRLMALLRAPEFKALSGTRGGVVRKGSQTFIAEVHRANGVQHLAWMIPDHEDTFSPPVEKIIRWLQSFQPMNATTLEQTEFPDICPAMGAVLVQPTAENRRLSTSDSCVKD